MRKHEKDMNEAIVVILSALYVMSLVIVDAYFNRLIFRTQRKLSYFSPEKQRIYSHWEWKVIGAALLIFLPILLPSTVAYLVGGIHYTTLYLIVLMLIPWDILFGRIVFDDWFGDTPSIAVPYLGWKHTPLWKITTVRLGLAIMLLGLKMKFGI